jgi:hypothetical protein
VYVYTVLRFYTVFFRALTGFLYSAFFAYTGFFYSIFKRKLYQFSRLLLYKATVKIVVFTPKKHAKPKNTPVQAHHRHATTGAAPPEQHRRTTIGARHHRTQANHKKTLQARQHHRRTIGAAKHKHASA